MTHSIFSFIGDNEFVNAWLNRKMLSDKLRTLKSQAESKVDSESTENISVSSELQRYSGELTSIDEELRTIHNLRGEENRIKGEIQTAQEDLQKAIKKKKTLITLAVIAVVVIGIAIAALIF